MPSSEPSAAFYYVYVLSSKMNKYLYIGFTKDLRARLMQHNKGMSKSTKPYKPWRVIFYEAHCNEFDARRREKCLKTSAGRQALRKMLREQLAQTNIKQRSYY